jgi:catechol 2,3-dioxygenase-like lactoylglutathione lyase family enzyme
MNIKGLLHININCTDFDRSRRFYERLGFEEIMTVAPEGSGTVARAVGLEQYRVRGALMKHPSRVIIDLLEWQQPSFGAAENPHVAQPGLARIAFITSDIDADVTSLAALGVEFLSDQPGTVTGPKGTPVRFICFRDPDGALLELVEMTA